MSTREMILQGSAGMQDDWTCETAWFSLTIHVTDQAVFTEFKDARSGRMLAEGPYRYYVVLEDEEGGRHALTTLSVKSLQAANDGHAATVTLDLMGETLSMEIVHRFQLSPEGPFLDETLVWRKSTKAAWVMQEVQMGFVAPLGWLGQTHPRAQELLSPIPFFRSLAGKKVPFALSTLPCKEPGVEGGRAKKLETAPEGWLWTGGDDPHSVVWMKYAPHHIEHSHLLMEEGPSGYALVFGGAGLFAGDYSRFFGRDEQEKTLGVTRFVAYEGGLEAGYYAFREQMRAFMGRRQPEHFEPALLYEPYFEHPSTHYSADDYFRCAAYGQKLGCEGIFVEPKWTKIGGSGIWDEERLGDVGAFGRRLWEDYGLAFGLHSTQSFSGNTWAGDAEDPEQLAFSRDLYRKLNEQRAIGPISYPCLESTWVREKANRLADLFDRVVDAGGKVSFLMLDGTAWQGRCQDSDHGHPVPSTKDGHARALFELCEAFHERHPNVVIELHDPLVGGIPERMTPHYLGYDRPGGFDDHWAYELMWHPMPQLLQGMSTVLIGYNMAYDIPMYIQWPMQSDNKHCLLFWFYAVTCKHLGIGGWSMATDEQRECYIAAVQRYKRLRRYLVEGEFYTLDGPKWTMLRTLPDRGLVVVVANVKNGSIDLDLDRPVKEFGLDPNAEYVSSDPSRAHVVNGSLRIHGTVQEEQAVVVELAQK